MFALLHQMAGLGANKSTLDAEVDDIMGESKPGETQLGPAASFCCTAAMTHSSLTNVSLGPFVYMRYAL